MRERPPAPALIPLTTWAQRTYPVKPPSIHTLRRWVREAKIVPQPEKHGREYRVWENAVYMNYNDSRRADEPETSQ